MLNLEINIKGVDNNELIYTLQEILNDLNNNIKSKKDFREDLSGQYSFEIKGEEEITESRFLDSIQSLDPEDLIEDVPTLINSDSKLYYLEEDDAFVVSNSPTKSMVLIDDINIDIDCEAASSLAIAKVNEDYPAINAHDNAFIDYVSYERESIYVDLISTSVKEQFKYSLFFKEHNKLANNYAFKQNWI